MSSIGINYSEISGSPEEADVYLLGDIHTDRTHAPQRRIIISQHARPGDIVLFESRQQFYELNTEYFKETRGLPVTSMGWDSEFHVRALKEIVKDQLAVMKALKDPDQADQLTREIAHHRLDKLEREFKKVNFERDKSLLDTVQTLKRMYPGKKIFVVGGEEHVKGKAVQWGLRNDRVFFATFAESAKQESLESFGERLFKDPARPPLPKVSAPTTLRYAPHPAYKALDVQLPHISPKEPPFSCWSTLKNIAKYTLPILVTAMAYQFGHNRY